MKILNFKKEKTSKKQLEKRCEKLWKEKVMSKSALCEVCGQEPTITGHHFFYRGSYGYLKFDLDNGIAIGVKCHFLLHHRDPKLITDKIIEKRGQVWYNELCKRVKQRPTSSYKNKQWLERRLKELKK